MKTTLITSDAGFLDCLAAGLPDPRGWRVPGVVERGNEALPKFIAGEFAA